MSRMATRSQGEDSSYTIKIKVSPKSSRNQFLGMEGEVYRIKITAPAAEGKANKALQALLAKRLAIPKTHVKIVSGERSRVKLVRIEGVSAAHIHELLGKAT